MTREELLCDHIVVPMFTVAGHKVNEYELRLIQFRVANKELDPGLWVEDAEGVMHTILPDGSLFNEEYLPVAGLSLLPHLKIETMKLKYQRKKGE